MAGSAAGAAQHDTCGAGQQLDIRGEAQVFAIAVVEPGAVGKAGVVAIRHLPTGTGAGWV